MKSEHGGNVAEVSRGYGIDKGKIIDFSANINPLGYPHGVRETIIAEVDSVSSYPDLDSFDLVSGLSEYHGIGRDNILVGNGSMEFIYSIPVIFKPERALIVSPAFSEYKKALTLIGAQVSYFQTEARDGFSMTAADLCCRLGEGFDILYICNPANPSGRLTSKDELCQVIARAEEVGVISLVDEAFIDFVESESVKKEIFRFPHLIVMRSMTKFFGIPGLRIGYVLAGALCIEKMRRNRPPWTVNSLGEKAAAMALQDRSFIRATRECVSAEREFLRNELGRIPGLNTYESGANFILVFMDERIGLNSTGLKDRLLPKGILIRDCNTFHGLGSRYFRVAVKRREENIILMENLKAVIEC